MKTSFKILIVDDDDSLRETFRILLSKVGYDINVAKNGSEAIEKVKSDRYDLVFLDIKMPDINGVDVFKEIKKISSETIVFFISAYPKEEIIEEDVTKEVFGFIQKPFDIDKILKIINNIEKNTKVLIVDDDVNIGDLLNETLKERGYVTTYVKNGQEMLKIIEKKHFDLVILDVVLPDIDGVEIFKQIKTKLKEATPPTIMISAYDVADKVKIALELGVKKFFKKPIPLRSLEETIQKILEGKKGHILVVDDDLNFAISIAEVLKKSGFSTVVKTTGKDGIEELNKFNYDVILVDIRLPDIDGKEVYKQIKKIKHSAKIILISGYEQLDDIKEAMINGELIFLGKPFNTEKLIEVINKCMERS
ncbi:MAG: response regulator [Endomicrobia bacterium]|nr:response regulator [Endomicrobiia bacterium]